MARPRKIKRVNFNPRVVYFKPRAIPLSQLEEVEITVDELETLRLSNLKNLNQSEAAKEMDIHQTTFHRTQSRAMIKVTDALVNGKAIRINGGEYQMPGRDGTGPRAGLGRGRMGGPLRAGPEGFCVCPKCGHRQKHQRGIPCVDIKCAKCGSTMSRE